MSIYIDFNGNVLNTFCAGAWLHSGRAEGRNKASSLALLESAIRLVAPLKSTCLMFGDMLPGSYSGSSPASVMDLCKELEGTTIKVPGVGLWPPQVNSLATCFPTATRDADMIYIVADVDVTIRQVLITEPWNNLNSSNHVRACIVVIDYDASYNEHLKNCYKVLAYRSRMGHWVPSRRLVNDKGVLI